MHIALVLISGMRYLDLLPFHDALEGFDILKSS